MTKGTLVPESPVPTVPSPSRVTAEVPIGLVVVQEKFILHELAPEAIVQELAAEVSVPDMALKVAVQVLSIVVIVTVPSAQSASPLHPAKIELELGEAVRVTLVPELYGSEQSAPQLMPAGLKVTVPEPVPDLLTLSKY